MQTRKKETEFSWRREVGRICTGMLLAAVLCVLMLFGCAGLTANGVLEEEWMDGAVYGACLLSTFGAGVLSHSRGGRWTLLHGVVTGGGLCILFGMLGVLIWGGFSPEQGRNVLFFCLCGGMFGGLLFGTPKKKRR